MSSKTNQKKRLDLFVVATATLIVLTTASGITQNSHKDLQGRFSLELPEGWKLKSEQMDMVYKFGPPEGSTSITMTYMEDVESLDELVTMYLEAILELDGGILPPPGSIVDMTLNGASARWIEYPFDMGTETEPAQAFVYIGAVVDDQKRGVGFFSILYQKTLEGYGESVKHSFETLQLNDHPLSGIENVQEVDIDYSSLGEKTLSPASTYEHNLFTIDLPAGWKSEKGSKDILVKLDKEGDQTCTMSIMGKKKNQFGGTRDQIQLSMMDGLMAGIPSMKKIKGPYEITTASGETMSIEEYEGSVEFSGQKLLLGAIITAAKNKDRGLGFMGIFSLSIKDEAVNDMLAILKTLR